MEGESHTAVAASLSASLPSVVVGNASLKALFGAEAVLSLTASVADANTRGEKEEELKRKQKKREDPTEGPK